MTDQSEPLRLCTCGIMGEAAPLAEHTESCAKVQAATQVKPLSDAALAHIRETFAFIRARRPSWSPNLTWDDWDALVSRLRLAEARVDELETWLAEAYLANGLSQTRNRAHCGEAMQYRVRYNFGDPALGVADDHFRCPVCGKVEQP